MKKLTGIIGILILVVIVLVSAFKWGWEGSWQADNQTPVVEEKDKKEPASVIFDTSRDLSPEEQETLEAENSQKAEQEKKEEFEDLEKELYAVLPAAKIGGEFDTGNFILQVKKLERTGDKTELLLGFEVTQSEPLNLDWRRLVISSEETIYFPLSTGSNTPLFDWELLKKEEGEYEGWLHYEVPENEELKYFIYYPSGQGEEPVLYAISLIS